MCIRDRNKKQKGQTLFIDARKLGTMVTRKLRELTDEDIKKIADTYNAFVDGTLEDEKGFCAVVTTQDIAKQDYILTPGRYVGDVYKRQILHKAGLPDIRFHDLRHTFATHAIASGVDAKTLSGILGHTNASFTLDTYTHVTPDMQKTASGIVGGFMEDLLDVYKRQVGWDCSRIACQAFYSS